MGPGRRVLLVSCYELGHQPLHLASSAGFLRAAGHQVRAADLAVEGWDDELLDWPELLCVAVPMHTAMRLATPVIERARSLRADDLEVALIGLYAPMGERLVESGMVDHLVGGEFEEELVRIAGGTPTGRRIVLDRLRFAPPARDLLPPLDRYAHLVVGGERRPAGYLESSRGCVHRCRHCPVPVVYDGRIRVIPPATVAIDAARQWEMGARHLTLGDPDFLNAVPHALAVARVIHETCPEMTLDITTKVEHIVRHRDIWAELRQCGVVFVVSAVESTSDRVLGVLDKGHDVDDVRQAVRLLREHGIELRPSLLPFTPWTELRDVCDLLDLIALLDLESNVDPVQLTIRLLLPDGSLLLDRPETREHLEGYDASTSTHLWRHPDPAVDRLQAHLAGMVAGDADAGLEPATTHRRIRVAVAQAAAAGGLDWEPAPPPPGGGTDPAHRPRLSEPWFCCAEPTGGQLTAVAGPDRV